MWASLPVWLKNRAGSNIRKEEKRENGENTGQIYFWK
jgi:hypothetical protein